jgi:hypothetical protein
VNSGALGRILQLAQDVSVTVQLSERRAC